MNVIVSKLRATLFNNVNLSLVTVLQYTSNYFKMWTTQQLSYSPRYKVTFFNGLKNVQLLLYLDYSMVGNFSRFKITISEYCLCQFPVGKC